MRRASELAVNGLFVKICGITNEEDALLSVAMGADALGFVFAAGSTRQVSVATVAEIVRRLPPEIVTLGVFRDELPERVIDIVSKCGLTGAQLHGHETAPQCAQVAASVSFCVQAFPAGDRTIDRAKSYPVEVVIIDNPRPGSGEVFDWTLAEVPDGKKLLLAGGLSPDNVADAVSSIQPWGVDVSSNVESSPGQKDPRKVRAFIANARRAAEMFPDSYGDASIDALHRLNLAESGHVPYDWQDETS
jgi:phosphoribosylanthranilate isomerase